MKHYNDIYEERGSIRHKFCFSPVSIWRKKMFKQLDLKNKDVLDFGCNILSVPYQYISKHQGNYFGYDIDHNTQQWLIYNDYYIDFWGTDKKFDFIICKFVYEHLDFDQREKMLKRFYELLKDDGILWLNIPFIENLNIAYHFKDYEHKPVSSWDDMILIKNSGFYTKSYLLGYANKNPFAFLLNLLIYGKFQNTIEVICKKVI